MIDLDHDAAKLYRRYQELQCYIQWTDADADRLRSAFNLVEPFFDELIDDFYDEIRRHSDAHRVITGGAAQIERLKHTLRNWLTELFSGQYDEQYVSRRWRVGLRHVEIGLDQVYTNMSLSRLRSGLLTALQSGWTGSTDDLLATRHSLNKLLDLDLAIIEDAYQSAFRERQQRADRLVTIGQMAGGVAHELRNPLNVVKTSIYYLLNAKNPTSEKTQEHLRRIERQVTVADRVITALSDFTKLPFPQIRPVPVRESMTEALELTSLPSGITVQLEIANELQVLADPDQLRIVVSNLFRNARDAMPQRGTLSITAKVVDGFIELEVSDTGVGMSRETLGKIMQPLYSTKLHGLGLGLAIARAIIEKHRGQLLVSSQEGLGTTFTLRLPSADAEPINS